MLVAHINEPIQFRAVVADGNAGLFPRARFYDSAGTLVTTLNLTHLAEGVYGASYAAATEGYFTVMVEYFSDSGHTTEAAYLRTSEDLEVSSEKSNIARLLGLSQSNVVIDNQTYSANNLISARIRTYDTKTHALAAGVTGLTGSYTMSAGYSGIQLTSYSVVQDS